MGTVRYSLFAIWVSIGATASLGRAQEIELTQADVDRLPKFGSVKISSQSSVELQIPDGFIGDVINGRVLLINDTQQDLPISEVATSCGCTSAIPAERIVAAGNASLILLEYRSKAVGKSRLDARFLAGAKEIHLFAIANTKPKLTPVTTILEFNDQGRAEFSFKKHVNAAISRFDILPTTLRVDSIVDSENLVRGTLVRDPEATPATATIIPVQGQGSLSEAVFQLRYTGLVEALPRYVIVRDGTAKFFLRGDVDSLIGQTQIRLASSDPVLDQRLACEVSKLGAVVTVKLAVPFPVGDYSITATLSDVSFPLSISVR